MIATWWSTGTGCKGHTLFPYAIYNVYGWHVDVIVETKRHVQMKVKCGPCLDCVNQL